MIGYDPALLTQASRTLRQRTRTIAERLAVFTQTLAARDRIEQGIAGQTICDLLRNTAEQHGEMVAFADPVAAGAWDELTWSQARERILHLAAGLVALGLEPGDRVALMLANKTAHVLADLAVVHAGGIPVTFYATLAPEQVARQGADSDPRLVVLDGEAEWALWRPALGSLPRLTRIISATPAFTGPNGLHLSWDDLITQGRQRYLESPAELDQRVAGIRSGDPLALLYTSGTTGNPKGVIVTHRNVQYEMAAALSSEDIPEHVRWVSYLPLAHIAERMFSIYFPVYKAWSVYFCPDAKSGLAATIGAVRPTAFFGVPRVWEKVGAAVEALLAAEPDPARRAAVRQATEVGRCYVESSQFGHTVPEELAREFSRADADVLQPIRALPGLGEAVISLSGGAPIPRKTINFFAGLGVRLLEEYGMTETSGAVTCNTLREFKLGTVGRPLPGVEVRIAEDGEILVRGPICVPGYLNRPVDTSELLDDDGWLHTGDIGSLDGDGFLSVVDRKKDLFITAGGESISPATIEHLLVQHPLIGQALAYGEARKYVVALLTLDSEAATAWAKDCDFQASTLAAIAEHPRTLAAIGEAVAAANTLLSRVQQVKRWRLLPAEWTTEEDLTPSLKVRRRVIHAKYANVIDALYAN